MPEPHLTTNQIIAIRDGELRDWAPVRHLRSCPECQAHLREARTLRVLLTRPESVPSPHPEPEELAAYAEDPLLGGDIRKLEAHVAACPQCFADLDAIRAHLRPAAEERDAPPDWVVPAAARQFQPPRTPVNLGNLVVEWLRRFGLSLELIPPAKEVGSFGQVAFQPPVAMFYRSSSASDRVLFNALGDAPEPPHRPTQPSMPTVSAELESEPVEVTLGDLLARITVRGRPPDEVKMTVAITRRQDNAPVAGAQLALETEAGPPVAATTDTSGGANFPLTQGEATLTFLSPVHAELKISF